MKLFGLGVFKRIMTHPALVQASFAAVANPMFVEASPDKRPEAEQTRAESSVPQPVDRSGSEHHEAIARAAVLLAHIAPDLAKLSVEIANGAATQAREAALLATIADGMTRDLLALAEKMRLGTREAGAMVGMIERIASQTKILSINAAIEASRSGTSGSAFAVIAAEIQALAMQTTVGTEQVVATIGAISEQAQQAEAVIGRRSDAGHPSRTQDAHVVQPQGALDQLNARIGSIVEISAAHARSAARLSDASALTRQRCEDMLLAVGVARFEVHRRAAAAVARLALQRDLCSGSRALQEACLRQALTDNEFIDLLYVTDIRGRQSFPNVARAGFNAVYGSTGEGHDWSGRPWFRAVARPTSASGGSGGQASQSPPSEVYISDLYRSAATDDFCFTVSTALIDQKGRWLGVLAADADLARLL
jgi:hypothetical protein